MNRGAQLLVERIGGHGSQVAAAEALGIDQGNLSRYCRGVATPGLPTRRLLEDSCSIPMRAWDDPPAEPPPCPGGVDGEQAEPAGGAA